MPLFLSILIIVCVVISVLISLILLFKTKGRRRASRYLSIAFLSMGCFALSYLFYLNDWTREYPIFFSLFTPVHYLIAPSIFLYVQASLNPQNRYTRWRYLHFLLFFVSVIDISPWLFMADIDRQIAIHDMMGKKVSLFHVAGSFFPSWVNFIARPLQGLVYLCVQSYKLSDYCRSNPTVPSSSRYKIVFRWLVFFTVLEWWMYITLCVFTVLMFLSLNKPLFVVSMAQICTLLMGLAFLVAGLFLYFNPQLLYRERSIDIIPMDSGGGALERQADPLSPDQTNEVSGKDDKSPPFSHTREILMVYHACLRLELEENEVFRTQGLTFSELANICKIPQRTMSYLLSTVYKKGFNEFINDYRLDYIERSMREGRWKELTLEGLAIEAGFSSRATFYLAFKKRFNRTPIEFIKEING